MDGVKRVFVIRSDNELVHAFAGPTLLDVVAEIQQQTDIAKQNVGIEFFDTAGHRLAPEFGPDWTWKTLQRTADGPDPGLVRRRLQSWVDYVAGRLRKEPVWLHEYLTNAGDLWVAQESPGQSLERVLDGLPKPDEESIDDCFKNLHRQVGHPTFHPADPLHNLWHLLGGEHS
jgi:hypothetical protein